VEFFAAYAGGTIHLGELSLVWVLLFYFVILSLTFRWQPIRTWLRASKENLAQGAVIVATFLLGVSSILVWRMVFSAPDGQLHISVLDVGSGDAILLQTPSGGSVLINGGPSAARLSDG